MRPSNSPSSPSTERAALASADPQLVPTDGREGHLELSRSASRAFSLIFVDALEDPFPASHALDVVRRSLYLDSEHTFDYRTLEAKMLTGRQQEIWDFLVDYVDTHGYPPTVREIGEAVGLASPSTVHAHLANLERSGLLKRDPTKPRALELVGRERREVPAGALDKLPLVGQIAAGGPLLAEHNVEDHLAVPETLRGDFLLRVKGDSMVNAGILDGDIVVVQRAQDARNGEIVVALAGDDESADEATVKRFFRESGRVRLQPENDALEPIYAQHVQVLGRVTGVFRQL
jgi:repressor LexA